MENVNYLQTVRLTWEERYKLYMSRPKKELARMLAERDKYTNPDGCKEFENEQKNVSVNVSASSGTYMDENEY